MTQITNDLTEVEISVQEWLAIRKEAGKKIDPQTAKVMRTHCYTVDPYGVYSDLSDEERQVGRVYFACSPDSKIWVHFGDLTDEITTELWKNIKSGKYNDDDDDMAWLLGGAE